MYRRIALISLILTQGHAFTPAFSPKARASNTKFAVSVEESSSTTTFDLNEYMMGKIGPIEKALAASVQSNVPQTKKICESMEYSLMAGGKRVRPVMCIAACEMFGGTEATAMVRTRKH